MKLISKNVHERLLRAAKRTEHKFGNHLLKKKIPVQVAIAEELKLPISEEAKQKHAEVESQSIPSWTSHNVCCMVKLSDYLQKLRSYKPDEPQIESSK